jgi:hypothetical protein
MAQMLLRLRQPFRLYSQAPMTREINFDASFQPQGKANKAVGAARNAGRTDAAHYEWSRARIPIFQDVFMCEVAMN